MCKLYAITGRISRAAALAAAEAAAKAFKDTQPDGFGFLAAGPKGLARGRYFDNYCGFRTSLPTWMRDDAIEDGEVPKKVNFFVAHGRWATNKKCVENCHPFRAGDLYLAHNGVLRWVGDPKMEPAAPHGCDSEQWLIWRAEGGEWKQCKRDWSGYAAAFFYDAKRREATLVKCPEARLYAAARHGGRGWVFATSASDLVEISKRARIQLMTKPVAVPSVVATIGRDGAFKADANFPGFAKRGAMSATEARALGVRRAATTKELFPDYVPSRADLGEEPQPDAEDGPEGERITIEECDACRGRGVDLNGFNCEACAGTGRIAI